MDAVVNDNECVPVFGLIIIKTKVSDERCQKYVTAFPALKHRVQHSAFIMSTEQTF